MIHAHIINIAESGSYEKELNCILKANNLPTIKVPSNPPSAKFISKLARVEKTQQNEETPQEEADNTTEIDTEEETASQNNPQVKTQQKRRMKGKDLGLIIHTSKSTGWPQSLAKQELIQGIEQKKYKVTYSENLVEKEEILDLIINDDIDLKECWKVTDDSTFKKIRTGVTKDRTPPARTEIKSRKHSQ